MRVEPIRCDACGETTLCVYTSHEKCLYVKKVSILLFSKSCIRDFEYLCKNATGKSAMYKHVQTRKHIGVYRCTNAGL